MRGNRIYEAIVIYDTAKLKEERLKQGLQIQEVAQLVGVDRRTISFAEKGRNPRVKTAKRWAEALGLKEEDIINGFRKTGTGNG